MFGLELPTTVSQCNVSTSSWVDGAPSTSTLLTAPAALQIDEARSGIVFLDGVALRRATLDSSTWRVTNVSTLHSPTTGWVEPSTRAAAGSWSPRDGDASLATFTPFAGYSMAWDSSGALLLLDPLCGLVRRVTFAGEYGTMQSTQTVIGNVTECHVVTTRLLTEASAAYQDLQQRTDTGDAALTRGLNAANIADGTAGIANTGFAKYIMMVSNASREMGGVQDSSDDMFLLAGANTYTLTSGFNRISSSNNQAQRQRISEGAGDAAKSKLRVLSLPRVWDGSSQAEVQTLYPHGTSKAEGSSSLALQLRVEHADEVQSTHVVGMTCLSSGDMLFLNVGGSFSVSARELGYTGDNQAVQPNEGGGDNGGGGGSSLPIRPGWPVATGGNAENAAACALLGCTAGMRSGTACEYKCYHPVCGQAQMAKCDTPLDLTSYGNRADVNNCFQGGPGDCTVTKLGNAVCDSECDIPACNFDHGSCTAPGRTRAPLPLSPAPSDRLPPNLASCLGPTACPSAMLLLDDECNEHCNIPACGDLEVVLGGCAPRNSAHLASGSACIGPGPSDCKSSQLGDGKCDDNCFSTSCLFDLGDCGVLPEAVRAPEAYALQECLAAEAPAPMCSTGYSLMDATGQPATCQGAQCGSFDRMLSDSASTVSTTARDWHACAASGCPAASLLGNNKCDMECIHPMCGPREHFYCFIQPTIELPYYTTPAQKELCKDTTCAWSDDALGNGFCDLENQQPGTGCDTPACNYDFGDCRDSLALEQRVGNPTGPTYHHTMWPNPKDCLQAGCASLHTIFDDKCDPECNIAACGRGETIFGGCAPNPVHWSAAEYTDDCASNGCTLSNLGDNTCHADCFIPACGFDLGDCGVIPHQFAQAQSGGADLSQCISASCPNAMRLLDSTAHGPSGSNCQRSQCGALDAFWAASTSPAWQEEGPARRQLQGPLPHAQRQLKDEEDEGDEFIPDYVKAANTTDTFIDNVLLYVQSSTSEGGSGGRGGRLRLPAGSPFVRSRPTHHKGQEDTENLLNNVAYPPELLDARRQVWFPTKPAQSSARLDVLRPVQSGGVWATVSNATMPTLSGRSRYEFVSFRGELWVIGGNDEVVLDPSSYVYSAKVPFVRAGNSTDSVMIYNVTAGTWRTGPSLNVPREDFGVVNLDDKALLVVGGVKITAALEKRATWSVAEGVVERQQILTSIEVFDAENSTGRVPSGSLEGAWLQGVHPDMPFARDAFGVALVNQQLWLLGGRKECDLEKAAA